MAAASKLHTLPGRLQVWAGAHSRLELRILHREIFHHRCYEQHGIALKDGDIIFDVGANVGLYCLSLQQRFQNLKVFCFEPVAPTYENLTRNLEAWGCAAGVNHFNKGLGATAAATTIEYYPSAPGNSTQFASAKRNEFPSILDAVSFAHLWKRSHLKALLIAPILPFRKLLFGAYWKHITAKGITLPCSIITLSSVVAEHRLDRIDLLKIDVEGAEFAVLEGIAPNHWPLIRQIVMEVAPANKHRLPDLLERLREIGFTGIHVESMLGGESNLEDALPAMLYATR